MKASLGPTSRSLVNAARAGLDPSAEIKARVRAKVAAAIAAPVPASSAPVKASLVGKLAVVGSIAAIVGGGIAFVVTRPVHVTSPRIEVTDRERVIVTESVSSSSVAHDDPAPVAQPVIVVHKEVTPTAATITLEREVALIDQAMAAQKGNDPMSALATLVTYERESAGQGQLEEDAAALVIDVKCHAHQPVTELLAAFDARYPSSAQRARLTTACR
ncbi:MAG: hypothetical protein QM831_28860 [Kofleriaceae bacterium]